MRQLRYPEIMLLAKIVRKLELRKYLLSFTPESTTNEDGSNKKDFSNMQSVAVDAIGFIIENIGYVDEEMQKLISSYNGITIDEVQLLEADPVIETLQNIFTVGMPTVLGKVFKMDEFKKKLQEGLQPEKTAS